MLKLNHKFVFAANGVSGLIITHVCTLTLIKQSHGKGYVCPCVLECLINGSLSINLD